MAPLEGVPNYSWTGLPALPVVRIPMQVHDGHHLDEVLSRLVKHSEGKCLGEAATYTALNNRVELWADLDPVERVLHRCKKPFAETGLLGLVPRPRVDHLGFGLGMKTDGFHSSAA